MRPALALALTASFAMASCSPSLPTGPVDVSWDAEACAECRMHVGEPAFAAQLQTPDGEVLNFDDPGCALRYLSREQPRVHAFYFHHHAEPRWLRSEDVAFVELPSSPMGYRLGAVAKGDDAAMSLEAARARVHAPMAEGGSHDDARP